MSAQQSLCSSGLALTSQRCRICFRYGEPASWGLSFTLFREVPGWRELHSQVLLLFSLFASYYWCETVGGRMLANVTAAIHLRACSGSADLATLDWSDVRICNASSLSC